VIYLNKPSSTLKWSVSGDLTLTREGVHELVLPDSKTRAELLFQGPESLLKNALLNAALKIRYDGVGRHV
jgi:hypothetical protein